MLIKSSGLANNIRYILNQQNQDDIITHQIKLDEMIKPSMHTTYIKEDFAYFYTHTDQKFTFNIDFFIPSEINNYVNNSIDIINYITHEHNPHYSPLIRIKLACICILSESWKGQMHLYINDILNKTLHYDYNIFSKLINIYHQVNWVFSKSTYSQHLINVHNPLNDVKTLNDILSIYDVINLDSIHPYDYATYLKCKEYRPVFKEEFKLYGIDRVINILPNISYLSDIEPYKFQIIDKKAIEYDLIYSCQYGKFVNYYLRRKNSCQDLIKPALKELFDPPTGMIIDNFSIIEKFLIKSNIAYWGNIYETQYDPKYDTQYKQLYIKDNKIKIKKDKDITICIVKNNQCKVKIDKSEYILNFDNANSIPTIEFKKNLSTLSTKSTFKISYETYEEYSCYMYNNKWYTDNGICETETETKTRTRDITYYELTGTKYINITSFVKIESAYISDYYQKNEFIGTSEIIPKKYIKHFYGHDIIESDEHVLLKLKNDKYEQIDWDSAFDTLHQTFIDNFTQYFITLTQKILLYGIGKFDWDFYKSGDEYKSACYISTSYMPLEKPQDYDNCSDMYVIIANKSVKIYPIYLNSISKENEILIAPDTRCIMHGTNNDKKFNKIIHYIELKF